MQRLKWVAGLLFLAGVVAALPHGSSQAVIDNGFVRLGIDELGNLGITDPSGELQSQCYYGAKDFVSMQWVEQTWEAEDCDHEGEGWGLSYGDGESSDEYGTAYYVYGQLQVKGSTTGLSFSNTATKATSVVQVGTDLQMSQTYRPSKESKYIYRDDINITNIGTTTIPVVQYRRAMTWGDYTGLDFSCGHLFLVDGKQPGTALDYTAFVSGNALPSPTDARGSTWGGGGNTWEGPPTGDPDLWVGYDLGNEWDFKFTDVPAKATVSFTLFYGAAPNENDALDAVKAVGANVTAFHMRAEPGNPYGINTPCTSPLETGDEPLTWIQAFGNIPPAKYEVKPIPVENPPKPVPEENPVYQGSPEAVEPKSHPQNEFPLLTALPHLSVAPGEKVSFIVKGHDLENDNMYYSALAVPKGAVFHLDGSPGSSGPDHGDFTWTPTDSDVGLHCGIIFRVTEYLVDAVNSPDTRARHVYEQATTGETCINVFDGELDNDHDGIQDKSDNCPGFVNRQQEDNDSDRIGDRCDNCPNVPNSDQTDTDGDHIGDACPELAAPAKADPVTADTDTDHDGVPDVSDDCPKVADRDQSDIDGDGFGDLCDADADNDGSLNYSPDKTTILDNCPDVVNADQKDSNGDRAGDACPQGQAVPVMGATANVVAAKDAANAPAAKAGTHAAPAAPKAAPGIGIVALVGLAGLAVLLRRRT